MKNLGKNDVKVLGVLVDYGCKVNVTEAFEGEVELSYSTEELHLETVVNDEDFLHEVIINDLKILTPEVGTPNSEMTDEQKGMIQLLFEIEKVLV